MKNLSVLFVLSQGLIGSTAFALNNCTSEEWAQANDACQEWEGGCNYATECSHFSNRRGSGLSIRCTDGVHLVVYSKPTEPSKLDPNEGGIEKPTDIELNGETLELLK